MILGLKGLKGSGKDTVAAYLIKNHGFERRAFADPLKKSVAALLDIPYHEIDNWKNDHQVYVSVVREVLLEDTVEEHNIIAGESRLFQSLDFRSFLQRYGTEAHRDIFGENFWLDYTLPTDGYYAGKKIAITDLRFENEARRVNICGGFVIEIDRPGLEDKDQHRSEQPFPPSMVDYQIQNHGSIHELYVKTDEMLVKLSSTDIRIRKVLG